jgi:seryl-tRNA synthetase
MHDIKFIRDNPAAFDAGLARRDEILSSHDILPRDERRRALETELQELQAKRNALSQQVGAVKKSGGDAAAVMAEVAALKELMTKLEGSAQVEARQLHEILSELPNLPAADVPDGENEQNNLLIKPTEKELERGNEEHKNVPKIHRIENPKQHFELGEALGLMDFETATKMSGARFTMLRGALAQLERALGNFMLDIHTQEFGYEEISPPLLVRDDAMFGTAQLPKFFHDQFQIRIPTKEKRAKMFADLEPVPHEDVLSFIEKNIYSLEYNDRYWLIPTAEVPLTNIVADSILDPAKLPLRFTARTPCFRAEAGAAGRDTRGMIRQHQFYKVEMVSITTPDQSEAEHERMTRCAETVLERLGLPYRRMLLCAGDMGFAAKKTYDLEVWLPGQNAYREISSCSNCGDFQARRMKARYKAAGEKSTQFVHTLNGSGVAVGRCLVAVLENYQQPDGSITVPAALRPYMNGIEEIR